MYDLIIVGAGALGSFHAYHAAKAGQRVLLLEKDNFPVGATVRNFGQVVPSGMAGRWNDYGRRSLEIYQTIQRETDLSVRPNGSVYVASDADEWQLLNELHDRFARDGYESELLTKTALLVQYPTIRPDYAVGGLLFRQEISVEPDRMIHALIRFIQQKYTVDFRPNSAVVDCQPTASGAAVTVANGKRFEAGRVLICSGHEFRLLFPDVFAHSSLVVSKLQMLQTAPLPDVFLRGNVLTGLTIRRYESFQALPAYTNLQTPDHLQLLKERGIHILFKQAMDGSMIVGDSHDYADAQHLDDLGFDTHDHIDDLILAEARRIVTFPLNHIRRRWAGIYSQTADEIFVHDIDAHIRIVTGIGGKGMTSGAGFAEAHLADWLEK
jgi:D-hydroxyproline dehydrogenase subunit beta